MRVGFMTAIEIAFGVRFWPAPAVKAFLGSMTVPEPEQTVSRKIYRKPLCTSKQPLKDSQMPNRVLKLRIVVFAVFALVLVLLAYFYGVSAL